MRLRQKHFKTSNTTDTSTGKQDSCPSHLRRITIAPHLFFVAITQWRFPENDRATSQRGYQAEPIQINRRRGKSCAYRTRSNVMRRSAHREACAPIWSRRRSWRNRIPYFSISADYSWVAPKGSGARTGSALTAAYPRLCSRRRPCLGNMRES